MMPWFGKLWNIIKPCHTDWSMDKAPCWLVYDINFVLISIPLIIINLIACIILRNRYFSAKQA